MSPSIEKTLEGQSIDYSFRPDSYGSDAPDSGRNRGIIIAEIFLESVCGDSIFIKARRTKRGWSYRANNPDNRDEQYLLAPRCSEQPLTLGELINLIDTAGNGFDDWDNPYGGTAGLVVPYMDSNLEDGLDLSSLPFFALSGPRGRELVEEAVLESALCITVTSNFYPQLDAYYNAVANRWLDDRVGKVISMAHDQRANAAKELLLDIRAVVQPEGVIWYGRPSLFFSKN